MSIPLGGTLGKHRKNQPSGAQKQNSASKPQVQHKKTASYITQNDTRNSVLHPKHMSTTTSPVFERTQSEKFGRFSTEKKKTTDTRNSVMGKRIVGSNTIEIKEAQNEDEEDKKQEVNKQISPSAQSSFSF